MWFVLQIFKFDNRNTSLKDINNKAYLKFVLAVLHCIIRQHSQKHFYAAPSTILFNKDSKKWMIHFTNNIQQNRGHPILYAQ
jgi:hypothetical protein